MNQRFSLKEREEFFDDSGISKNTDLIFELFMRRKYKRDEPHLPEKIKERIRICLERDEPVKLVGFWGAGEKTIPNWADTDSCDLLKRMDEDIREIHSKGLDFHFILADKHGISNGFEEDGIRTYLSEMADIFDSHGFTYVKLSELWEKHGIIPERIDQIFERNEFSWGESNFHFALGDLASIRNRLHAPEEASKRYFIMRTLERRMLEEEFEDRIFHTYSNPLFSPVLPDMPRIHIYSYKKGRSNSPWFINEERKSE